MIWGTILVRVIEISYQCGVLPTFLGRLGTGCSGKTIHKCFQSPLQPAPRFTGLSGLRSSQCGSACFNLEMWTVSVPGLPLATEGHFSLARDHSRLWCSTHALIPWMTNTEENNWKAGFSGQMRLWTEKGSVYSEASAIAGEPARRGPWELLFCSQDEEDCSQN